MCARILFTDGAKYVADEGGAYWLLDEIALAQRYEKRVMAEEFQVWTLKVNADRTATLSCGDGNNNTVYTKADSVHRFSGGRNHALVCQQHDLSAERTLKRRGRKRARPLLFFPLALKPKPTGDDHAH